MPTLSEADSKALLRVHGVPFPAERQVDDVAGAVVAAAELGHPVVLKLGGAKIAHKTERGLVPLSLGDDAAVSNAASDLLAAARPDDGDVHLLVCQMVYGNRELIAGLNHDAQFGMTVMVGVGGILAEAIADVVFRLVPIDLVDAHEMIDELSSQRLLAEFRGEPAINRSALAALLVALSDAAESDPTIRSIDLNPLIIVGGQPLPVDALVEQDDQCS
jgi:succinyl-CoA synthetase beta subunit